MKLQINWYKNKDKRNSIIGVTDLLPDSYCHFEIVRYSKDVYWVRLPARAENNMILNLTLRDPEIARDFCEDYLNYNLRQIINHQIRKMKGTNLKFEKSVWYYEDLRGQMDKYIEKRMGVLIDTDWISEGQEEI